MIRAYSKKCLDMCWGTEQVLRVRDADGSSADCGTIKEWMVDEIRGSGRELVAMESEGYWRNMWQV